MFVPPYPPPPKFLKRNNIQVNRMKNEKMICSGMYGYSSKRKKMP